MCSIRAATGWASRHGSGELGGVLLSTHFGANNLDAPSRLTHVSVWPMRSLKAIVCSKKRGRWGDRVKFRRNSKIGPFAARSRGISLPNVCVAPGALFPDLHVLALSAHLERGIEAGGPCLARPHGRLHIFSSLVTFHRDGVPVDLEVNASPRGDRATASVGVRGFAVRDSPRPVGDRSAGS